MARSHREVQWCVVEQLIDDDVSGLTFRFEVLPTGEPVLRIYGAILPHGNRMIRFSNSGELAHLATSVLGAERPNWPHCATPSAVRHTAAAQHTPNRTNGSKPSPGARSRFE